MIRLPNPRIAVLVDLPREPASGGHVKYWERIAQAAVRENAPIDLTVYFSGEHADEVLSPNVRFRFLPPIFSTEKLKFLPYLPAHTDLAPFHPNLADELPNYDVIHTTDGFFAFARTAARAAQWSNIPLVNSFHTDTPAYAELFTRHTIESLLGPRLGRWVDRKFNFSGKERRGKERQLKAHLRRCIAVLAMRHEDIALAKTVILDDNVKPMRLGVDKDLFIPRPEARAALEREHPNMVGKFLVLFVGRVDVGKNMPILMNACVEAIAQGVPLHLMVVGRGPMSDEVNEKLGEHVTLFGTLPSDRLAQVYASSDCLAIASDIEIGGLIGLEALSCGCPVLVSRESGVAQSSGALDAMQMVESDTPSWRDALSVLANDPAKQQKMREAALTFRGDHLAGWREVLTDDFMPVWQRAAAYKRDRSNSKEAD